MHRAAVDALRRVHEARLDDVDGRRDDGGEEAGAEGGHEVARHVVGQQLASQDRLLQHVVRHQFGGVDDSVAGGVRQKTCNHRLWMIYSGRAAS